MNNVHDMYNEAKPKVCFPLDHINHVRNVAGVECVGIGSSFDGIKQ